MAHMVDSAGPLDHVRLDADGRIDDDLPCIDCGYNQRSLPTYGACPECGAAVRQSMRYLLHFADPAWLRRLCWGLLWVGSSFLTSLLGVRHSWPGQVVLVALVAWGVIVLMGRIRLKIIRDVSPVGTILVVVIGLRWLAPLVSGLSPLHTGNILTLVGWWLLTTPEPGRREIDGKLDARKAARIAMTLAAVGGVVYASLLTGSAWSFTALTTRATIVALHALGLIAAFRYLARLAKDIPRPRLAKQAVAIGWCLAVSAVLAYLGATIRHAGFAPGSAGATSLAWLAVLNTVLMWGIRLVGIGSDVAKVWAIVLCIIYARSFLRAARPR